MNTIQAKLTLHKNIFFRSKLEVKWAKLFENIGLSSIYEPCSVNTRHGQYVPDFYLPSVKTWVEVKPVQPSKIELDKFIDVCVKHNEFGLLVQGFPQSHPSGVEPHLARCNVHLVLPSGINVRISADELYQLAIYEVPGMIWVLDNLITNSKKHYGGYLPPLEDYLRVIAIAPARKKIIARRKSKHIRKSIGQVALMLTKLNHRLQRKGAA